MRFDILISTLNRRDKLQRLIASIFNGDHKDFRIVITHDISQERFFTVNDRECKRMGSDWALLISDDTELAPDCLSKLDEAIKASDVTSMELPIEYCQIFDFPVQGKDVVIKHYQASRNR